MQDKEALADLRSIRDLMERSSRFISLSGMAGVVVGMYALAGAWWANRVLTNQLSTSMPGPEIARRLALIALAVLVLSMATAIGLTVRRAKRRKEQAWNPVSRRLLLAGGIPFVTGGLFILILFMQHHYEWIAAASLVFYGLSVVAGSTYTFTEVRWLGFAEIATGLVALSMPDHGLLLWALGFGALHMVYGIVMHFRYER